MEKETRKGFISLISIENNFEKQETKDILIDDKNVECEIIGEYPSRTFTYEMDNSKFELRTEPGYIEIERFGEISYIQKYEKNKTNEFIMNYNGQKSFLKLKTNAMSFSDNMIEIWYEIKDHNDDIINSINLQFFIRDIN